MLWETLMICTVQQYEKSWDKRLHWNPKIIAIKLAVFFLKVSTAFHVIFHKSKILFIILFK